MVRRRRSSNQQQESVNDDNNEALPNDQQITNNSIDTGFKKVAKVVMRRSDQHTIRAINRKVEVLVSFALVMSVLVASGALAEIAWLGRGISANMSAEYQLNLQMSKAMNVLINRLQGQLDSAASNGKTVSVTVPK